MCEILLNLGICIVNCEGELQLVHILVLMLSELPIAV